VSETLAIVFFYSQRGHKMHC